MTQRTAEGACVRIVSGLQSSGRLHLGNWFGAVRQLVRLQDAGEAFYFIAAVRGAVG